VANAATSGDQREAAPLRAAHKFVGTHPNVFAIIAKVRGALERAGQPDAAREFVQRAFRSRSYDKVLQLCMAYVDVR